jgi:hypothetical protein
VAIAFVNTVSYAGLNVSDTTVVSPSFDCVAGNLLVVLVKHGTDFSTTATLSDTAGNTFTRVGNLAVNSPNLGASELFYARNVSGNGTNVITATFTASVSYREIVVGQWSGVDTVSPLDAAPDPTIVDTGASSVTSAQFSTTQADELIVGAVSIAAGYEDYTAGQAGSTPMSMVSVSTLGSTMEYAVVSSIQTSITTSMSWATGHTCTFITASFKAPTSYFGYNVIGSQSGAAGGYTLFNSSATWTCPGSGSQAIRELSAYCSGSGNARIAVYNADRSTLIASTDSFALSTTAGWQGRTNANISPSPATLTGGASYVIAVTSNDQQTQYYNDASAGNCAYILANYTGGFPASLGVGTGIARDYSIRCGVQAASGSTYSVSASVSASPDMGETATMLLSVLSSLSSTIMDPVVSRGILVNVSGLSSGASLGDSQQLRAIVSSALAAAAGIAGTGGSAFSTSASLAASLNDLALSNRAILVSQIGLTHAVDMLASSRATMAAASVVAASAQAAFYGTIPGVGRFLAFVIDGEPVTFFV